jgi:hypothetical protein
MKVIFSLIGIASTVLASPVEAKTRYESFEARNSVFEG